MKTFKKQEWGFLKHPTYPWSDLFSGEQDPKGRQRAAWSGFQGLSRDLSIKSTSRGPPWVWTYWDLHMESAGLRTSPGSKSTFI